MGKQAKRRIWKKKQKGNRDQTYTDERKDDGYSQAIKENEKYWSFYRAQGFFNDEEFEAFRAALQRELPVSFRFQGCNKDREQMKSEMESRFFSKIHDSDDASVCAPKAIPWYTEAYQTPMPRAAVRSHPILTQLHNFLVTETELGNLSRQEAVSMIPPLLLQPTSDHFVLDLCAAPGSKTAQLIEMIHRDTDNPKGMVVANDLDKKRCYMLIRQTLKRFHTPSCVVTCEDATNYPKISAKNGSEIKFDRVLADVICSGDGTMRKNPGIWKTWSPQEGLGLHRLQLSIARRAAEMLRVGGQMVYSTCSLNPIEDEAVVAQLLREAKGALRLVDTREKLPELKRLAGVSTWRVFDKEMREFKTPSEVEEKLSKMICASCFPPTEEEATKFHLDYSMRIAPHQNDTGGFYVALIEKVSETDFENNIFSGPQWKRQKMYKDEPFSFLRENDDRWKDISGHYGVAENFPYQNLFSRRLESNDSSSRQLFFANDAVRDFVQENMTKVSIQNAGMKMFGRTEAKVEATRFRLSQEGVRYLFPFMSKKKIMISKDDMLHMLKCEQPLVQLEDLACKEEIRKNSSGSLVVYCNEEDPVCCWVGYHTIAPYVSKEERLHHLRMLGVDCSEIEQLMKSKRKEKAAQDRDAAWAAKEPKKETAPDGLPDVKMESAGEEEEDVKEEIGI